MRIRLGGGGTPGPDLGFSPRHMDRSADPRRDFYRYAAGGWLDRAEIAASEGSVSAFSGLSDEIDRRLLALVEEAARDDGASGPRRQVSDYYRAAMDLERLDALGLEPLAGDLALAAGAGTPAKLARVVARHQLVFDGSALFNVGVVPDAKDHTVNALYVGPGDLTLDRHEYLDDDGEEARRLYADHVGELFAAAGDTAARAKAAAATVLAVERELAAGRLTPVEARDPDATYHKTPLADLATRLPSLDLGAYLEALGLEPPETAIVQQPGALDAVEKVLSGRPADEVRTHVRWRVLSASAPYLGRRFRDADRAFADRRAGLEEPPPRRRVVLGELRRLLAHPLSRLYVEAWFPPETRRALAGMVDHLRAVLRRRLQTNPWLGKAARATAVDKLDRVEVGIGHPDEWLETDVEIAPDDHLGNVLRLTEANSRRQLTGLGERPERRRFALPGSTTPIDVNAAYQPGWNAIEITAAIAQPPFYDPRLDEAVNYGAIGAVIGHELSHGFDTLGRRFDADGDLRDWWQPADEKEFAARTRVLVEQFGAYEVLPGVRQDGHLTVTESTADLGGVTIAHRALRRALAGRPRPADLDGLSAEQRFFVAWAQLWRSKARPELLAHLAATDPHPVSPLRAAGPLVHLEEFFAAFGIVDGDPMWRPPGQRVRIW